MEETHRSMTGKIPSNTENLGRWPSSSDFPFTLHQVKNAFTDIKAYMVHDDRISIFLPETDIAKDVDILHNLHVRLQEWGHSAKKGLAHVTRSLTVLLNLEAIKVPDGIQWEVFIAYPDRPCTILCVTDDITNPHHRKYSLCLTRNVICKLRKFTSEHVTVIYGLIGKDEIYSYTSFSKQLQIIYDDTSRFCNPDSLFMTDEKGEDIIKAFLVSIATTDLVTILKEIDCDKDTLWFLTPQQFKILIENIDKDIVVLNSVQNSGGTLLLVEVGRRLNKIDSTVFTFSNNVCNVLRRKNVAELIFTSEEIERGILESDVKHLVAEGISVEDLQRIRSEKKNLLRIWLLNSSSAVERISDVDPEEVHPEDRDVGGNEEGYVSALSDFEEEYHSSHEDEC